MGTPVWDDRLLSVSRAFELGGGWRYTVSGDYLYCVMPAYSNRDRKCGQLIAKGPVLTVEGLLAAVLRHAVTAHDLNLFPQRREIRDRQENQDAGGRGRADRGRVPRGAVDRHPHETPAARGGDGPADSDPGGNAA